MEAVLPIIPGIVLAFAAGIAVGWIAARRTKEPEQVTVEPEEEATVEAIAVPKAEQPASAPAPARPVTKLGMRLYTSPDPIGELRAWLRTIERRQANGTGETPDVIELFLARRLREAGIAEPGFALSHVSVARPHTNGMFYLRLPKGDISYGDTLSMLGVEAALNAGVLAEELFALRPPKNEEEIFAALETLNQRITAQANDVRTPPREGDGEWAARLALSHAVECLRLPYRLITGFRMNLADGLVAIEFETTPAEVFPQSALVSGAGIVPATSDMRAQTMTDYTLRLAVLMAECAFAASEGIREVWVAGIERTPESHACLISATLSREAIEGFTQDPAADVETLLAQAGARIRPENGRLTPVDQGFSLNEERFCPPSRYEEIGLSTRTLNAEQAEALGTAFVRGLEIDEAARRSSAAEEVAKHIAADGSTSCEEAVRAVLALCEDTDDETLRTNALRCAQGLVEGRLNPEPLAVLEALNDDGGLSDAVTSAQEFLSNQQFDEATDVMQRVLGPLDATSAYTDTPTDEWRGFSSYVDRVLYNLTFAREGVTTHLVPEAYVEAIIMQSIAHLASGRTDEAIACARRASALCPTSSVVRLHLVQCLEQAGLDDEVHQQLVILLSQAHDAEGLGYGYHKLSLVLWKEGKHGAARAAFQRALSFMPREMHEAFRAVGFLFAGQGIMPSRELTPDEIKRAFEAEHIPFAPTEDVSKAFMKAARASLDAEIFPVARDFMKVLGQITKDDVLFGVFRSLEDEPDR